MTEAEKQAIIDAVLSSLRTNSRTIAQLTPVTQLDKEDYFELNGGRKVSFSMLKELVPNLTDEDVAQIKRMMLTVESLQRIKVADEEEAKKLAKSGKYPEGTEFYTVE